jgi:hypothetical protein
MVERQLPKLNVAGSSPVSRSSPLKVYGLLSLMDFFAVCFTRAPKCAYTKMCPYYLEDKNGLCLLSACLS